MSKVLLLMALLLMGCGTTDVAESVATPVQAGVTVRIETTNPMPHHLFRVHVHPPGSDEDLVPPQTVPVQATTVVSLPAVPAQAAVVAVHTLAPGNRPVHTHRAEFTWRAHVEVPMRITIRKLVGIPATATVRTDGPGLVLGAAGGSGGYRFVMDEGDSGGGTVTENGHYMPGPDADATDTIDVADSSGDLALIFVNVSPSLAVAPPAANVEPGGTLDFTVTGNLTPAVWDILVNRSGGRIDRLSGRYVAGPNRNVQDVVEVTTARGSDDIRHRTVLVCVGSPLTLDVPNRQPTARTTMACAASGGSGQGYRWQLVDGPSGGHVDALTGVYTAGPTAGVTDVLAVSDSEGAVKTVNLLVTPPIAGVLSIAGPPDDGLQPTRPAANGASLKYTASGGSNQGYRWSLAQNPSGGRVDPDTGLYSPGSRGGVTDLLTVTDSAGTVASLQLSVAPPLTITFDPSGPVRPLTKVYYTVSGGYPPYIVLATSQGDYQPVVNFWQNYIIPVFDADVTAIDAHENLLQTSLKVLPFQ